MIRKNWEVTNQKRDRRLLIAGIRLAGETEFQFYIPGNPDSRFPPLALQMSLSELQNWLCRMNNATTGPTGTAGLRLVN